MNAPADDAASLRDANVSKLFSFLGREGGTCGT